LLFLSRFPASAGGTRFAFRAMLKKTLIVVGMGCLPFVLAAPSLAQKAGGGGRAAKVGVATIKTEVLANLSDVQARIVAAPSDAVTATTNAIIELQDFRLGEMVKPGALIARQDRSKLVLKRTQVRTKLAEVRVLLADSEADIKGEKALLDVVRAQADLLAGKAGRARELVANNALPVDAAETALNASLTANAQVLSRESTIARKTAKMRITRDSLALLEAELAQLDDDIEATELRAPSAGQIVYLADYRRGYAREGEVVAKIMDLSRFEVEAEIPVTILPYLGQASAVKGRALDGTAVEVAFRVALPQQNLRTATRTIRFEPVNSLPKVLRAANAVIVLQVPISSPAPQVIVPKDAVLPITGGHMVYVAEGDKAKRQIVQLGSAVKNGFIVLKGLSAGQKVVIRGNEQLSDGKTISVGDSGRGKSPDGKKWGGKKPENGKSGTPKAATGGVAN